MADSNEGAPAADKEWFMAHELDREEFTLPNGIRVAIDTPLALRHFYPFPRLGALSIPLYRGSFTVGSDTFRGVASLSLNPRVEINFGGRRPFTEEERAVGWRVGPEPRTWLSRDHVTLPIVGVPTPPKTDRVDASTSYPSKKGIVVPWPSPLELGRDEPVDRVTFFVLNGWRAAMDGFFVAGDTLKSRGGLRFDAGDWEFTFTMRPDATPDDVLTRIRREGEHTATHVGMIRRKDRQPFLPSMSTRVLEVLEFAFAFALGRTTACVLPVGWVGIDAIWARWHVDRWVDRAGVPAHSWLDEYCTGEQLRELIECLLTIRGDTFCWNVFEHALGYYLTAQDTTPPMRCNLAVPALTFMSEAALVAAPPLGHAQALSKGTWDDLGTQEQIRRLLTSISASTSVPSHFADLEAARASESATAAKVQFTKPASVPPKPTDALSVLVKMRNDVAHPKRTRLQHFDFKQWFEAAECGIEWLLLALLHWIGYHGRYMAPTAVYGGADSSIVVPWAPPPSPTP